MLRFVGDFKKLIPLGYRFQRLFARNYIAYNKNDVWIWKKGKSVDFCSLEDDSSALLEYLISTDFEINNPFNLVIFNQKTKKMEEYNKEQHELIFKTLTPTKEEAREHANTYKEIFLSKETMAAIKELYEGDFIAVVEILEVDEFL